MTSLTWTVRRATAGDFTRWRELYAEQAAFFRVQQPDTDAQRVWEPDAYTPVRSTIRLRAP